MQSIQWRTICGCCVVFSLLAGCGTTDISGGSTSTDGTSYSTANTDGTSSGGEEARYDIAVPVGAGTSTEVSDGVYQIVLSEVPTQVVVFSESPNRTAKYMPTVALGMWDKMFPDEAPNSVLFGRTGGTNDVIVFEMGKPTYDETNATLTFQATLVGDSAAPLAEMTNVDLLIDPTAGQWITIGWDCASAALSIVAAAVEDGANPLADLEAIGATISCIHACEAASW